MSSQVGVAEFATVVDTASRQLAIEIETDSLVLGRNKFSTWASAQDISGQLNVGFSERSIYDGNYPKPLSPIHNSSFPPYDLGGLLRAESGYLEVKSEPKMAQGNQLERSHRVHVTVLSSPEAINSAQATLGRRPGIDAFRLVRHDGNGDEGEALIRPWIQHAGQLLIPTATLLDWATARHDITLDDHVHSWYGTPAARCLQIADKARQLEATHGDLLDAPKPERPLEADEFANATEVLHTYTDRVFRLVYDAGRDTDGINGSMARLDDFVNQSPSSATMSMPEQAEKYRRGARTLFRQLGILQLHTPQCQVSPVHADYVANLADILIKVGGGRSDSQETDEVREARTDRWKTIKDRYAA